MATQRILRGVPALLSVTLVDSDGSPRAAVGDVTVEVKRADGTTLIASRDAVAGSKTGVFTTPATAADANALDQLTAVWTEDGGGVYETIIDVVGGYYFSIEEARRASQGFTDKQKYPDDLILQVRRETEEECERICNRAFVPRYRRMTLMDQDGWTLALPDVDLREIKSLAIDGAAVSPSSLTVRSWGEVRYATGGRFGTLRMNGSGIVVAYEYGLDDPPADLRRAALIRFASRLTLAKTGAADRSQFQIVEGRTFGMTVAGRGGSKTGIGEVDEVYEAHSFDPQIRAALIR